MDSKAKKNVAISTTGIEDARVRQAVLLLEQHLGKLSSAIAELERRIRRVERREV